ncbi:MAG: aminotransferase class V-fold PLP-dependent enzyme [Bryobacteraceae bacterium]
MATRRGVLQAGSLLSLWPFRRLAAAANKRAAIYDHLGVRPVVNFQGTHTTIGASKMWPELHDAMAEASREYVVLEELQQKAGDRIAKLIGCEAAMVTTGAAGAITLGTCAALTGDNIQKVRQLPNLAGLKTEAIIQKAHRNGYDHAVRNAGLRIVEVESKEQLAAAAGPQTALLYYLGGASHDYTYETPVALEDCLAIARKAGFPVMVDAANMLPPFDNLRKLAAAGVDLICISGGKHMRGPQCSGILAGRRDLIRAAWLNSSPNSDSLGRPMKVGREEVVGALLAIEKYSKLDFDALERQCQQQAAYLMGQFARIPGLRVSKTPFDRTRHVHRVRVEWDETALGRTARDIERELRDGNPRIFVLRGSPSGIEFTVFMNEPGDEKLAVRRLREVFKA